MSKANTPSKTSMSKANTPYKTMSRTFTPSKARNGRPVMEYGQLPPPPPRPFSPKFLRLLDDISGKTSSGDCETPGVKGQEEPPARDNTREMEVGQPELPPLNPGVLDDEKDKANFPNVEVEASGGNSVPCAPPSTPVSGVVSSRKFEVTSFDVDRSILGAPECLSADEASTSDLAHPEATQHGGSAVLGEPEGPTSGQEPNGAKGSTGSNSLFVNAPPSIPSSDVVSCGQFVVPSADLDRSILGAPEFVSADRALSPDLADPVSTQHGGSVILDEPEVPTPVREPDGAELGNISSNSLFVNAPSEPDLGSVETQETSVVELSGDEGFVVTVIDATEEKQSEECTYPNSLIASLAVKTVEQRTSEDQNFDHSFIGTGHRVSFSDNTLQKLVRETCMAKVLEPDAKITDRINRSKALASRFTLSGLDYGLSEIAVQEIQKTTWDVAEYDVAHSDTLLPPCPLPVDASPMLVPALEPVRPDILKQLVHVGASGKIATIGTLNSKIIATGTSTPSVENLTATLAANQDDRWNMSTRYESCGPGTASPCKPKPATSSDLDEIFPKDSRRRMLYEVLTKFQNIPHE